MTNIICNFLNWLAGAIVEHIPVIGLGSTLENVTTAISKMCEYIGKLNWLIPVGDIILILGIFCTIQITKVIIFVVNWVVRRIFDIIP